VLNESGSVVTLTADAAIIEGSSSGNLVRITQTGTGNALVVEDSANPDSTPFVVTNDGKVGIGCSPSVKLQSSIASSGVSGVASTAAGLFENSGNADVVIAAGTSSKSRIAFGDSGDWIVGRIDYDHSDNSMRFGTAGLADRMRIDSSGNLLVGITSTLNSNKFLVTSTNFVAGFNVTNGTGEAVRFYSNGTGVGTISVTGSSTSYNTSSDYRLKENITEITDGITRVKQLNPSRFNFISDPDKIVDGFIAHEVQDIVPEAVSGEKDAVNEDGSIDPQGIDQSKLVPLLTAALQEAIALIESQQSQIDALTARIEALENT